MTITAVHSMGHTPVPRPEESPAAYAARLATFFAFEIPVDERRELAQFFTPLDVARFMAKMARPTRSARRLLDPGAGTGLLASALCERLPAGAGPIHLDAYEVDQRLASLCEVALRYAKRWLARREILLSFTVHRLDYVRQNAPVLSPGLFDPTRQERYDVAIANPPYFKLQKLDPRSVAASAVVHGQPNIYALFMAITSSLLTPRGVMVTITPRSFTTGDYFRAFRRHFFSTVRPEVVHLFHSRKEAFKADTVLQENVILRARRALPLESSSVTVSTSAGVVDLRRRTIRKVALSSIVDADSRDRVCHIPADEADDQVIAFVRGWSLTLRRLGLEVSTGPVVAFRTRKYLVRQPDRGGGAVPLLWLQHVRPLTVQWPIGACAKPQYISACGDTHALLLPNATYVVLRRFTAKEEHRRLTVAPLLRGTLPGRMIGLENHLNYVHRPHGHLHDEEAFGLAALLGSALLDRYIRVSNGNTQVNATEVRALPLPPLRALTALGSEVRRQDFKPVEVEAAVAEILRVPRRLQKLLEADSDGQS